MDSFCRYMDKIHAEDDLKVRTKMIVSEACLKVKSGQAPVITTINRKDNFRMKKALIAACAVLVVGAAAFGGYMYYKTPVNYVSLDINPSVELGLNAFDQVVDVDAANQDGQNLVDAQDVTNEPVDQAVSDLVQEAVDQNYVADDGSTVISVTAESDDTETAEEIQEKSKQGVNLAMSAKKTIAAVYADCSDLSLRTEAKELNLSPGKYKLIKMLQALDPTIKVEDYANAKVKDIIGKANELVKAGALLQTTEENSDEITDKIKTVASDVEKAKQNAKSKKATEAASLTTTGTGEVSGTESTAAITKKNGAVGNGQTKTKSTEQEQSEVTTQAQSKATQKATVTLPTKKTEPTQTAKSNQNPNATKKK